MSHTSDVRAQTRRRRDSAEQPVFLRKTFHMVNSAPTDICCWSDKGDTFIVKDPDLFATHVIPQFFKHNNFSSFVRQLNFYGFRKVKSDSVLNTKNENKWWEFRHENFQRGKPQLLSEIKRATHYGASGASPDQQAVEDLKGEVQSLKMRLQRMNDNIHELTGLVNELVLHERSSNQVAAVPSSYAEEGSKKRKVAPPPSIVSEAEPEEPMDQDIAGSFDGFHQLADPYNEDTGSSWAEPLPSLFPAPEGGGLDDDAVDDLLRAMDFEDLATSGFVDPTPSAQPVQMSIPAAQPVTLHEENDLATCLSALPPTMQERFLEKLVAAVAGSLTSSVMKNGQENTPPIALPLASAALGAFVTQYVNQMAPPPLQRAGSSFTEVKQQC